MLIHGALVVVHNGKKNGEIVQSGVYFGEMAAVSGEVRSGIVVSKDRSRIRWFPGDKLFEVIGKYPDVTKHVFKSLVGRLQQSNKIIVKLAGHRL